MKTVKIKTKAILNEKCQNYSKMKTGARFDKNVKMKPQQGSTKNVKMKRADTGGLQQGAVPLIT